MTSLFQRSSSLKPDQSEYIIQGMNKRRSGEIGLNIRILANPKVGQDQVSAGVSVPRWHATPVAGAIWKPMLVEF